MSVAKSIDPALEEVKLKAGCVPEFALRVVWLVVSVKWAMPELEVAAMKSSSGVPLPVDDCSAPSQAEEMVSASTPIRTELGDSNRRFTTPSQAGPVHREAGTGHHLETLATFGEPPLAESAAEMTVAMKRLIFFLT